MLLGKKFKIVLYLFSVMKKKVVLNKRCFGVGTNHNQYFHKVNTLRRTSVYSLYKGMDLAPHSTWIIE